MDVLDGGRVAGAPNESEVGHNKLEDMVRRRFSVTFLSLYLNNCLCCSVLDP